MKISKSIIVVTMICMTIIAAGCHKVFGGGWIDGLYGGKAHFAFQAQCRQDQLDDLFDFSQAFYVGKFQYNDRLAGVRFHGEVTWQIANISEGPLDCEEAAAIFVEEFEGSDFGAYFAGECWTQPGQTPGTFSVLVEDEQGGPGWNDDDFIRVETDCTPDGDEYFNEGTIRGGNIIAAGHGSTP